MNAHEGRWVVFPKPCPRASLRLFCFPYAGGGASLFYPWVTHLPDEIELCPLQLPGRENRLAETPFTQLERLVPELANVIYPYLDRPFAFFGHSMGSLIAFELARYLRQQLALSPLHLFVSGHQAPQIPSAQQPISDLPEDEFIQKIRELNGTPENVFNNEELMQLLFPLLRADFTVSETYTYSAQAPFSCSLSAFGGVKDSSVSYADLSSWRDQTAGTFTLRMFPGDHFFLHRGRNELLQAVKEDLEPYLKRNRLGEKLPRLVN